MLHRHLLQVLLVHAWNTKRQFKVERELIEGCHHAKSPHRSIIHFSVNKAATQYTKSILSRCLDPGFRFAPGAGGLGH